MSACPFGIAAGHAGKTGIVLPTAIRATYTSAQVIEHEDNGRAFDVNSHASRALALRSGADDHGVPSRVLFRREHAGPLLVADLDAATVAARAATREPKRSPVVRGLDGCPEHEVTCLAVECFVADPHVRAALRHSESNARPAELAEDREASRIVSAEHCRSTSHHRLKLRELLRASHLASSR
jgi:hypothetical protein